jgi:hypothetical protein
MVGSPYYDLINNRNYYQSQSAGTKGWYDLNSYIGQTYYHFNPTTGYGSPSTFGSPMGLFSLYATSPFNEWGDPPGGGGK